ncbi:hypothetical protein [Streptomyces sp. NPDC055189]
MPSPVKPERQDILLTGGHVLTMDAATGDVHVRNGEIPRSPRASTLPPPSGSTPPE